MLDLCICTHNPRLPILSLCLGAIETQISPPPFRILLVDNASQPPLTESLLGGLRQRGIPTALIREQRLGLTAARLAALQQTSGEWLVFIDDDNVIDPNFLQLGSEFALAHPEVGAFGGRISLAPKIKVPEWMAPLLGGMGVKEEGDKVLINSTMEWGPHDPPGAGLWVRRVLLERFGDRAHANPVVFELGRRGNGLAYCEDALIVKGARDLGFYNAYVPTLRVTHYLKAERFTFCHAIRSLIGYGRSHALYERIMALGGDQLPTRDKPWPLLALWNAFNRERHQSIRFAATQAAYRWAYERSRRALG
jgi:glycosyltransferase involved in cell wall biosynthesis